MRPFMISAQRPGLLAAILFATLATTACRNPRAADVYTLNTPIDVAAASACLIEEGAQWRVAFPDDEDCVHANDVREDTQPSRWDPHVYAALISNEGEGALQIYSLDTRSTIWLTALRRSIGCLAEERAVRQPGTYNGSWVPERGGDSACSTITGSGVRAFDNNPTVPGNDGIRIPGTIGPNTASAFAGLQVVAASGPNTLHVVNYLTGEFVGIAGSGSNTLALDFPVAALANIRDGGWIIAANARDNELVAWQPTLTCDNATDVHYLGCDLTIDFGTPTHIALDGTPAHIATALTGDVYVSMQETPWVTRVSLNDNECPPTAPCNIPITHGCNDGIDNDNNGLADNEDPSCYSPFMEEGELFADAPCADGVDNDGDGLIDALDPQCASRSFAQEDGSDDTCNDGIDNDGDGLVDADDPHCTDGSEFQAGGFFTPPSDATPPRYTREPVYPGAITVVPEGDIVMIAEAGGNRASRARAPEIVFLCGRALPSDQTPPGYVCPQSNTRLNLNAGDALRRAGLGVASSAMPNSLHTTTNIEFLQIQNPDNIAPQNPNDSASILTLQTRRLFVTATDTGVYTIDIDRVWAFVDKQGASVREYEALMRYTDAAHSPADVRNLRLIKAERVPALPPGHTSVEPGRDTFFPSLYAINPEGAGGQPGESIRFDATQASNQGAFVGLETEARFCFQIPGVGCVTNPPRDRAYMPYNFARERVDIPNDTRLVDENWLLEWEGSLLINTSGAEFTAQRNDAIVLSDDGWVQFLGQKACERVGNDSAKICDLQIGWAVCPELEDLCTRGADLCGENIDICNICPRACHAEVNLCRAGAQPGDILILPPLDPAAWCKRGESGCTKADIPAQCLPNAATREPGVYDIKVAANATVGNEYRIVEVRGDAVRVEPLDFADRQRYRLPTRLPSSTCYRRPFTAEIVAANAWTLAGSRVVNSDTAYVEQDGICTWDANADGQDRVARPIAGVDTVSRLGIRFNISPGDWLRYCETQANAGECAHAMRGFRILFSTEDNYSPRAIGSAVGTMAISSDSVINRNLLRSLLLFIDPSTNQLTVLENDESFDGTIVP